MTLPVSTSGRRLPSGVVGERDGRAVLGRIVVASPSRHQSMTRIQAQGAGHSVLLEASISDTNGVRRCGQGAVDTGELRSDRSDRDGGQRSALVGDCSAITFLSQQKLEVSVTYPTAAERRSSSCEAPERPS